MKGHLQCGSQLLNPHPVRHPPCVLYLQQSTACPWALQMQIYGLLPNIFLGQLCQVFYGESSLTLIFPQIKALPSSSVHIFSPVLITWSCSAHVYRLSPPFAYEFLVVMD
jgi:hypothetical protein